MKFLQVIALIILISYSSVEAAKSYNPAIINCYIRDLKDANQLGDDIDEFQSVISIVNCDDLLDTIKTEVVKETVKNIKDIFNIEKKEQCVKENLLKNKLIVATFKAVVYEVLQESSGRKYEVEITDANEKLENLINESTMYCLFKEDFSQIFDEIFTDDEEEEDSEADYCARKHVLDNQLLDTSVYTLPLNPKNVDTTNVNCEAKLKEVIKKIEAEVVEGMKEEEPQLAENNIECRLNAFRADNAFSKMIVAGFFKEVNLSDEQKEVEKRKFIVMMGKVALKAAECDE